MTTPTRRGDLLVRFDQVTCSYGDAPVLHHVDLEVGTRDFVGVVGPSGSGKTTLLRALLGAVRPVSGRVVTEPGVRLAYVPQVETVDWNFPVTVAEVVSMSRPGEGHWGRQTGRQRVEVEELLDRLGLGGLAQRHIRQLSGGQQQRVFLARAMVQRPHLLVLDEPTSGVDVQSRHEVLHVLADLHHEGVAILLTTHDLNGLAAHLPRLVCFNQTVIADGPPLSVLSPAVLERTYGAPMEVLEHGGMPVVLELQPHRLRELRERSA